MRRVIGLVVLVAIVIVAVLAWRGSHDEESVPIAREPVVRETEPVRHRADTRVGAGRTGSIVGRVVDDENDAGIAGHAVSLLRDGEQVAQATTDAWGAFELGDVPPGVAHEVRVAAEGCATLHVPSIAVVPGERRDIGDLVLGPTRALRLLVTDENAAPVPGAVAQVYRELRWGWGGTESSRVDPFPEPIVTVPLDEQGRATVDVPAREVLTVAVSAPGHARVVEALIHMLLSADNELRFVLPKAERLEGIVVDAAGRPIAGAVVLARRRPRVWDSHHGERADSAALWHRTTSAADGTFAFDRLPPGTIDVVHGRSGGVLFGLQSVAVPAVDHVRLVVGSEVTVRGRVIDVDGGDPVAAVVVAYQCGHVAATVVADAQGRWTLPPIPAGAPLSVMPRPPSGWRLSSSREAWGRALLEGESPELEIVLRRAATLSGTVTWSDGAAPHAIVRAITLPSDRQRGFRTATATADAHGRYHMDDVAPGRVAVVAVPAEGGNRAMREIDDTVLEADDPSDVNAVELRPGEQGTIDVTALLPVDFEPRVRETAVQEIETSLGGRRVRVRGRVTTSDGVTLRGLQVFAEDGEGDQHPVSLRRDFLWRDLATVTADGHFDTAVELYSDSERFFVAAVDARHEVTTATVELDPSRDAEGYSVDVVLRPLPIISGHVTSEGTAVAGAAILLKGTQVASTDSDGAFSIPASSGYAEVAVIADGFVRAEIDDLYPPLDEPLTFELEAARSLSGTVVDAAGEPVGDVIIRPVDEDGELTAAYVHQWHSIQPTTPVTGPDGRFHLTELPEGAVWIELVGRTAAMSRAATVIAGPFGPGDEDVRIVTEPARRLTGRVIDSDGNAVERIELLLEPLAEGRSRGARKRHVILRDGAFDFTGLLVAEYELAVVPRRSSGLQPTRVEIDAEQTSLEITLDRAATISGKIVWSSGQPYDSADLYLRPLDDVGDEGIEWDRSVEADDDGSFRFFVRGGIRYAIELDRWQNELVLQGGDDVRAGQSEVQLVVRRRRDPATEAAREAGELRGTVVGRSSALVHGASVQLLTSERATAWTTTDADGVFVIGGLTAEERKAPVSVIVHADGLASVQVDDVEIGTPKLRIGLQLERTISGRLLDANGDPAIGYRIRAFRGSNTLHDIWRADLDADGNFELRGLSRGVWRIDAIVERGGVIREVVTLAAAKGGKKGLELRLPE